MLFANQTAIFASFTVFCIASASGFAADQPIPWETLGETAERTGYTVDEIRKYFPPIETEYDLTGLAKERLKKPPAPGIHPRIFFNPEDLPDIRQRLTTTKSGKTIWPVIKKWIDSNIRVDSTDRRKTKKELYERLSVGDAEGISESELYQVAVVLSYESFRCLIEEDAEAGKKASAVAAAIAQIVEANVREQEEKLSPEDRDNWQKYEHVTYREHMGLIYDFAYNFMTTEQRNTIRKTLAFITKSRWHQGMDALPAWNANTSNWITFFIRINAPLLAIEGEEGFDPEVYRRSVEAVRKFLTIGVFPSGATFEGMGKNQVASEYLIAFAKRGDMLIAAKNLRANIMNFHLHDMQPFGGGWTYLTDWGGSEVQPFQSDITALKYAYPEDPVVDFVFRNTTGEDYEKFKAHFTTHTLIAQVPLFQAIFCQDWDDSLTWEEALQSASQDKPLDFFCPDRGQMIARSSWDKEALQLIFLPRCAPGGHTHADRGDFTFSALGRVWAERYNMGGGSFQGNIAESRYHNMVLIDGMGQPILHTPSCKVMDYQSEKQAAFCAGDAKLAWNYRMTKAKNSELITTSPNDMRLEKSLHPWMDMQWSDLPHWYSSKKLGAGGTEHNMWVKVNDVKKAFRTTGLVRGKHPYALIIDDIEQGDGKAHLYHWIMQAPDDVEIIGMMIRDPEIKSEKNALDGYRGADYGFVRDIILGDKEGRRLLVRVLENCLEMQTQGERKYDPSLYQQPGVLETYLKNMRWGRAGKRLVIPSQSIEPKFKILLYPFREGEALPITEWNSPKREVLSVSWPDQSDEITFSSEANGRTLLKIQRGSEIVINVK